MGIHDGHRSRMKQEFLQGGLTHFSEPRALELLLFYSRMQGDVNPTAHALLDAFGSLAGVLDADPQELMSVPGVGENTAVLLKLIPALAAKYLASRTSAETIIRNSGDLRDLFAPYFFGARNELSFLACFDSKLKLLGVRKISEGGPNETNIGPRQIATAALSYNASAVVLAHNHPSGLASPSDDDISTTRYLFQVLRGLGIVLYDHVILADDDMVSMRDSGYFMVF
ncbi:MAG: DNA repair protein RadC [Clostridiales bacterium]|uniref:JAB domain-containing protein n=1 Tax=Evtepia sp. TaxID=2773933 RepID=UPI00298346CA|nr:DNA repair protein RadC [Evtepia sp.]MDD7289024.1 DNA repair protein RadC [Clostridiales bacterium]MDY3993455.1 DNA repair protein RadC [Evtepia sp.]MDY4429871.1 DNA repair protein RadC [Evtepia sp.]